MNPRQFFNSGLCVLFEKLKLTRIVLRACSEMFFPEFIRFALPRTLMLDELKSSKRQKVFMIYGIVFFFLFVVQGLWAYLNGQFWPDSDPLTKNYLEDYVDLVNYTVICEMYFILGYYYLRNMYFIDDVLRDSHLTDAMDYSLIPPRSGKGIWGAVFFTLLALLGSTSYALDIRAYEFRYWFMESGPPNVTFSGLGHYYLYVNLIITSFVLWLVFAHFGIFNLAATLSERLRVIHDMYPVDELREKWGDENKIKEWLKPIAVQILLSKWLVFMLFLNVITWKANEAEPGLSYVLMVIALLIFGIWIFSLPRYYIQLHIFRIWQKIGRHEYKDLSMPWLLGATAMVDLLLFYGLIRTLAGSQLGFVLQDLSKIVEQLFF